MSTLQLATYGFAGVTWFLSVFLLFGFRDQWHLSPAILQAVEESRAEISPGAYDLFQKRRKRFCTVHWIWRTFTAVTCLLLLITALR